MQKSRSKNHAKEDFHGILHRPRRKAPRRVQTSFVFSPIFKKNYN